VLLRSVRRHERQRSMAKAIVGHRLRSHRLGWVCPDWGLGAIGL
jgi:hypothetical protein